MMATTMEKKANRWSAYLAVAAISSLATTWVMETPALHKKERKLEVVEQKILPSMAARQARTETKLLQADCDKVVYVKAALKGVLADDNPLVEGPDWKDLKPCKGVKPAKVSVPKIPEPAPKS